MEKNLKYFMCKAEQEVVTVPGLPRFTDNDGNVLDFEIKVLDQAEIDRINELYRKHSIATDKKGNPLVANGEVIWKTERAPQKAARHIIVEALQYPDLHDKSLMEYYGCVDVTEMPLKVFSKPGEYTAVSRMVMNALGLGTEAATDEETANDAKN
jgi:hypothetical protein